MPHWTGILIVALLVVMLFGAGRISGLMGEVAKGITSFRKGLKEGSEEDNNESENVSISDDSGSETPSAAREDEKTQS